MAAAIQRRRKRLSEGFCLHATTQQGVARSSHARSQHETAGVRVRTCLLSLGLDARIVRTEAEAQLFGLRLVARARKVGDVRSWERPRVKECRELLVRGTERQK